MGSPQRSSNCFWSATQRIENRNAGRRRRRSKPATRHRPPPGQVGLLRESASCPPRDLQRLYREVAKKVHPDLAGDPREQKRRNHVMAEVNKAYAEGDIEGCGCFCGSGRQARMRSKGRVWLSGWCGRSARSIRRGGGMERIAQEIERLRSSNLGKLREAVRDAERQGRALLAEMGRRLDQEIGVARRALRELRGSPRGI
jgi:hypothetical protein